MSAYQADFTTKLAKGFRRSSQHRQWHCSQWGIFVDSFQYLHSCKAIGAAPVSQLTATVIEHGLQTAAHTWSVTWIYLKCNGWWSSPAHSYALSAPWFPFPSIHESVIQHLLWRCWITIEGTTVSCTQSGQNKVNSSRLRTFPQVFKLCNSLLGQSQLQSAQWRVENNFKNALCRLSLW